MSKNEFLHLLKHSAPITLLHSVLLATALTLSGAAQAQSDSAEPESVLASEQAAKRPLKQCIECHEAYFAIADSKHFVQGDPRTPKGTGDECKSCHGDTSEHNRKPRVKGLVPIVYGKKAPPGPQIEACLNCHQGGARIHFQGSAHERSQQVCASCHKAHTAKDPVMVAETQAGVCFECHKDRRAEMLRTSTHAIKNGFFTCSSCHQPHGAQSRALLQKNTVNETCYTCHADKRGPFLWEHRSVQDDCTNCHNPHGTNNAPMLKARMPYLCQQCHSTTTGHSNVVFSGTQVNNPLTGSDTQRMLGKSCANCHSKIHGSNHPSGARFQR